MEPGSLAEVVALQRDIRVPQSGGSHDDDDRRVGLRGGVLLAGVGFQQLLPLTPMRWWPAPVSSAPGLRLGAGLRRCRPRGGGRGFSLLKPTKVGMLLTSMVAVACPRSISTGCPSANASAILSIGSTPQFPEKADKHDGVARAGVHHRIEIERPLVIHASYLQCPVEGPMRYCPMLCYFRSF